MNTTTATIVTTETVTAGGNTLDAGTYRVRMPSDYDAEIVTAEDILLDADIVIIENTAAMSVGDRVEGGDIPEDYDIGEIIEIDGDQITVAWDGSNETTTQHRSAALRVEMS